MENVFHRQTFPNTDHPWALLRGGGGLLGGCIGWALDS